MAQQPGSGNGGGYGMMHFTGITAGGGQTALPAPVSARLDSSLSAPADSFTGEFPLKESFENLTGLTICDDSGDLIFTGSIDVQKQTAAGKGASFSLTSRSLAGLLLDSEAKPQTYCRPSLPMIFNRHGKPFGLTDYKGSGNYFEGTLTVSKGMSDWDVIARFCKTFLQVTPRVAGTVLDASGSMPQTQVRFGGSGGLPYGSAQIVFRDCDLISEIDMLSEEFQTYEKAAAGAMAESLGIVRRRFLADSSADAVGLIAQAEKKAFAVVLDCPTGIPAPLGSPAALSDSALGDYSGLTVTELSWRLDSAGEHCIVTLRR